MNLQNCPNCGANLNAASLESGKCAYCGTAQHTSSAERSPVTPNDDRQDNRKLQSSSRRPNRLFVYLWVFACFAIGIRMIKHGSLGLAAFVPFAMGIVGAVQMLRRRPN